VTGLRDAAAQYLAMRRALGFKLSSQAGILMGFVDYCEQHQLEHSSADAAVAWAVASPRSRRQVSPHTIAACRDTIKLLLGFTARTLGKQPADLHPTDLDAPMIGAFLTHLETQRHNSVTTRNARLAAIRALFRHAALHAPEHAALIERVLAIPAKRCDRAIVGYLNHDQTTTLLAAPDRTTPLGRRDHALLLLATQPGCGSPN
jgi:site-specific recombinase XerD